MNIVWFVSSLVEVEGKYTSNVANIRLRCLEPACAIERLRPDIVVYLAEMQQPFSVVKEMLDSADVAIFSQVFGNWDSIYQYLQTNNVPIIMDICDASYKQTDQQESYQALCQYRTASTVSSEDLAEIFNEVTPCDYMVVADCVEGEKLTPSAKAVKAGGEVKLLWNGERADLQALTESLALFTELSDYRLSMAVRIQLDSDVLDWFEEVKKDYGDLVSMQLLASSQNPLEQALAESDVVIVPNNRAVGNEVHAINNVMVSLWAGKPCVVYPLSSCQQFEDSAELDTSLALGLKRLLDRSVEEQNARIARGQSLIESTYTPDIIAEQWLAAINKVLSRV